ncbi:GAF domain-containing protein [Gordonia alkanivorans]|uniref:GAF domain-containing protein n=1 Tax=Gordonia alkanivorans TaxID=84096 RepID=UPI0004BC4070|nr:GAF domain-containing protein [Gordonia alkanivorans]
MTSKWHVIETLIPDEMSVVWARGRQAAFQSVPRLLRHLGIDPTPFVEESRISRAGFDRTVTDTKGKQRRVITTVSPGLDGIIHAVNLWVGDVGEEPGAEPIIGPMAVDLRTKRIASTPACYQMSAVDMTGYGSDRDAGMFLHKVTGFDQVTELVNMIVEPEPGKRFQGTLTVKHDDGRLMNWQGIARINGDMSMLRGFAQDLSAFDPPTISSAELARMDIGTPATRSAAVLLGFPVDGKSPPLFCFWLTKVPEALANEDMGHSWEIHPDSLDELWRAQRLLAGSVSPQATLEVSAKIRSPQRDWVDCTMALSKYPTENIGANILVTRLTIT